jgi:hypothetical protein
MRHKKVGLGFALLVLLLSAVLGATVLREPIAYAASPFQSVLVANTADNPVPVAQQGTANVNVTNETLSVAQPPVTGGGGQRIVAVTINEPPFPAQTASAMTVGFRVVPPPFPDGDLGCVHDFRGDAVEGPPNGGAAGRVELALGGHARSSRKAGGRSVPPRTTPCRPSR